MQKLLPPQVDVCSFERSFVSGGLNYVLGQPSFFGRALAFGSDRIYSLLQVFCAKQKWMPCIPNISLLDTIDFNKTD